MRPRRGGGALAALLALDDALARLIRTTGEPALGQMRLAWWRESLERLDAAPPPAEPVLATLRRSCCRAACPARSSRRWSTAGKC
ncbi:MAG: squalene/phytoene synthase family protein [Sphingomonas sp.]